GPQTGAQPGQAAAARPAPGEGARRTARRRRAQFVGACGTWVGGQGGASTPHEAAPQRLAAAGAGPPPRVTVSDRQPERRAADVEVPGRPRRPTRILQVLGPLIVGGFELAELVR